MVETLIKKPVKEAVREAMAEESYGGAAAGSGEKSNRILRPALLIPLSGLAAAVFYWRRRKADTFGPGGPAGEGGPSATSHVSTEREPRGSGDRRSSGEEGGSTESGTDEEAETTS